jgi:hypothetical protein
VTERSIMRFHVGHVPESPDFHPVQEGWHALREPRPGTFTVIAGAVGLVVGAAFVALWFFTVPHGFEFSIKIPAGTPWYVASWRLAQPLLAFALLIVIHELIHAAVHPGFGRSRDSVLGLWPTQLVFYAHYDHEQSRNQFLLCLAMPLIVISLGLWALELLLRTGSAWFPGISVVNAMCAGGDVTAIVLLAWQVPHRATVRNLGWFTWWRIPAPAASSP